jgi:NADH-quinone oxidoreductase subunit B
VKSGFHLTTLSRVMSWARSSSLWYMNANGGCCADEVMDALGARYDLERFGCLPQADPRQADLMIVTGMVSYRIAPYLKALHDQMLPPKYVLAIGSCASCGGAFAPEYSYSVVPGAQRILPVDVFVPGCPPRPEAIMNGLIALQEKIRGSERAPS